MKSMKDIKIEDIIGVWECKKYSLVITKECIVLTDKEEIVNTLEEPTLMIYISDKNNKEIFNTIHLSQNIYIYQLITEDSLFLTIENENLEFYRLGFINEFKFYRNTEIPSKYIAIRWYSPWEYIAMVEFQEFNIARVLTGKIENDRTNINKMHTDIWNSEKWIEISFEGSFPQYKQKEIVESIKQQLL